MIGKTLSEMFLERHPLTKSGNTPVGSDSPAFAEVITRCCQWGVPEFHSVEELYTATLELLRPIRLRARETPIPELYQRRLAKIQAMTSDPEELSFGRTVDLTADSLKDQYKPWNPKFSYPTV